MTPQGKIQVANMSSQLWAIITLFGQMGDDDRTELFNLISYEPTWATMDGIGKLAAGCQRISDNLPV